jgi:hypothetical protein
VDAERRRAASRRALVRVGLSGVSVWAAAAIAVACGPDGVLPSTVDPGQDFDVAEVVFDENFFYCRVEPMLFQRSCGAGDVSQGDVQGGCHFNVTSYRLTDYELQAGGPKLVGETCAGLVAQAPPLAAQQNYQSSQARMKRDPDVAALLNRPTGQAAHPRIIFASQSPEADLLREWATKFSSQ